MCDLRVENEIVGEALVALRHEELKEMAVMSVGHRLTILKGVYDIKVKQEIPFNPDHYIPPCMLEIGFGWIISHRLTLFISGRCKRARSNRNPGGYFPNHQVN